MTRTQQLVQSFYKDDAGNPILLSDGQDEIFSSIAMKVSPRIHVMCHTRFGKSWSVGLAVLTRVATFPERWSIIAGTKEKAAIIMSVVNAHIFDNEYVKSRFIPDKGDVVDDIRRYRNKNHITFKIGKDQYSEVFIGSAKDALGFGAENVVEDESALIDDNDHSLVVRMLGDNVVNNFLCKIGNPFNRNHFLKSYHDPMYKKIIWDCYRSLKEGKRMTQAIIDENRGYSFFKILYECSFPSASEIDESGWMYLLADEDIKNAEQRNNQAMGRRILGLDVARGGRNFNSWCLRSDSVAEILAKTLDNDLIDVGDSTINFARENNVQASDINVDDTGVGGGVTDYLKSRGMKINPVNFGSSPSSKDYLNTRAEVYAGKEGLTQWVKGVGQLKPHKDWIQLTQIRYKKDASGKTKIEPKEEMRKRGIESPDVADSLALTFAKVKTINYSSVDPAEILAGGVQPFYPGMPG